MSDKFIHFYAFIYRYCVIVNSNNIPINNYNIFFILLYNFIKTFIKESKIYYNYLKQYIYDLKLYYINLYKNSRIISNFYNNMKSNLKDNLDVRLFKIDKKLRKYILSRLEV
jgi:hypothetical protein